MRRCENPGCPFHARHGFPAEFNDAIERCRRCDAALPAPESESQARASAAGPLVARLAVALILLIALLGFARVPIPGYEGFSDLGFDTRFGGLALRPALVWLISATVFLELGSLAFGPTQALRSSIGGRMQLRTASILLAVVGLAIQTWWLHRGAFAIPDDPGRFALYMRDPPSLLWMLLSAIAALAVLLAVAAANDRWGLGHGISLVIAGVVIHELSINEMFVGDPARVILVLLLVAGLAVWIARPTRASASGRTQGDPRDGLGLGLKVPSCGLIPIVLVTLIPAAGASILAVSPGMLLFDLLGLPHPHASAWPPEIQLVVIVALAAGLAWLFTRPALLVDRWRHAFPNADPAALRQEADALFKRTTLRSTLLIVVLQLLTLQDLPAYAAAVLAALLVDFAAEFRARNRHPGLVAVELPTDVPGAEAFASALRLDGRPALIQGVHHRALYRLFGTWIPLRVLVREQDRARAEQLHNQL